MIVLIGFIVATYCFFRLAIEMWKELGSKPRAGVILLGGVGAAIVLLLGIVLVVKQGQVESALQQFMTGR